MSANNFDRQKEATDALYDAKQKALQVLLLLVESAPSDDWKPKLKAARAILALRQADVLAGG